MANFKVAIEALRSDAKLWDSAGDQLEGLIWPVRGLILNGSADVMLYGADIGIDTTYNESRAAIEGMLGQASRYFHHLAATQRTVATEYEKRDSEEASGFRATGDELGGS